MVTNFSVDPEISHYSVILIYFSRRLMQIKYHSSQRMNIKGVRILGQFALKMESYLFFFLFCNIHSSNNNLFYLSIPVCTGCFALTVSLLYFRQKHSAFHSLMQQLSRTVAPHSLPKLLFLLNP